MKWFWNVTMNVHACEGLFAKIRRGGGATLGHRETRVMVILPYVARKVE